MTRLTNLALAATLALAAFAGTAPAEAGGYGGGYGGHSGGYSSGYSGGSYGGHYSGGYAGYSGYGGGYVHKCFWKPEKYWDAYRHAWFVKRVQVCH